MARIVVRCPICKATNSVDNHKKKVRCPICKNRLKLEEYEIVVPPEEKEEYHGKGFHNHTFLGYFTIFFGIFGVDYFIKKCYKKGLISFLFFWTGAPVVLAVFRAMEILALEDDEIDEYYRKIREGKKNGGKKE